MAATQAVVMLMTADEERGSGASRDLLEDEARRSDAVCVLEPALPGGALKTSRKGAGEFELTVRGISAHAGLEPEKGSSAISELAVQILAIEALADRERGVSVNVGLVNAGVDPTSSRTMPGPSLMCGPRPGTMRNESRMRSVL